MSLETKQTPLKATPTVSKTANGAPAPASQSIFDSKDYVAGKDNVWQLMLQKASRKVVLPNSTLVVLGDKKNGKTALLNKFGERSVAPGQTFEYVLDYSYLPVKNRYNADKDEVLGYLNVYQWDDPAHADVLQHFSRAHGLDNTVYVLTVSLAEPWNTIKSVLNWLNVLTTQHTKIMESLSADEQKRLKEKICAYTQLYVDPSVKKKQGAGGDMKSTATTAGELEAAKSAISMTIPKFNIGVPIVIVGTKAELLNKKSGGSKSSGSDDRFEFLTRRLRKIALDFGATLLFTSSAGQGLNHDVLQDYIFHRLYNFQLESNAKPVASIGNDDYNLYIPAGYDSMDLIDPTGASAKDGTKEPTITVGSWTEATPMEEVFENSEQKQKAGVKAAEEVSALDNATFFRSLQLQLEKDNVRTANVSGNLNVNPHALTSGGTTGRASVAIPVSPSHSQNKATLDKLEAMRRAAGVGGVGAGSSTPAGGVAGARSLTPTHSQSTRDLHSTPGASAGSGVKPDTAGTPGSGAVIQKQQVQPPKQDMKKTAVKAFFKSLLGAGGAAGTPAAGTAPNASPATTPKDARAAVRNAMAPDSADK